MRLPWQCPTCYAEIGDKSHVKMLTCPYCGSLLIVNKENRKFYRVPKENSWYYFSKVDAPGYIKFGKYEEIYEFKNGKWYLLREGETYILESYISSSEGEIFEVGEVNYIWGDLPFIAPPKSTLKTAKINEGLIKIAPKEKLLFINIR